MRDLDIHRGQCQRREYLHQARIFEVLRKRGVLLHIGVSVLKRVRSLNRITSEATFVKPVVVAVPIARVVCRGCSGHRGKPARPLSPGRRSPGMSVARCPVWTFHFQRSFPSVGDPRQKMKDVVMSLGQRHRTSRIVIGADQNMSLALCQRASQGQDFIPLLSSVPLGSFFVSKSFPRSARGR